MGTADGDRPVRGVLALDSEWQRLAVGRVLSGMANEKSVRGFPGSAVVTGQVSAKAQGRQTCLIYDQEWTIR